MRLNKYLLPFALIRVFFSGPMPLLAQSADPAFWRHDLTGGFRYELGLGKTSYTIPSAPGWNASYSYRPRRWLDLEAGLEQVPRPVGSSVCCRYVSNANDQLYLVPFGVRYRWESNSGRVGFSVGGGGAYLRHAFGQQNDALGLTGASAWGGQVAASAKYAIRASKHFTTGVTARYYYFKLNQYLTDRMVTVGPDFTISF